MAIRRVVRAGTNIAASSYGCNVLGNSASTMNVAVGLDGSDFKDMPGV